MKLKNLALVGLCISGLALTGCSDDSEDTVENLAEAPGLQGVFRSDCGSSDLLDVSERNSLEFQGNDFSRVQRYYLEENCSSQEAAVIEYDGDFKADEDAIAGKAGALDIEIKKVIITVNNEAIATMMSGVNFCGINKYEVGKSYELSGEMTDGVCPIMNVPTNRYGSFDVEDDKLLLDSQISGMATEKDSRDTELDTEFIKD